MTAPAVPRGPRTFRMDLRYRLLGIENKFIEAFRADSIQDPVFVKLNWHRKPTAIISWFWQRLHPGANGG